MNIPKEITLKQRMLCVLVDTKAENEKARILHTHDGERYTLSHFTDQQLIDVHKFIDSFYEAPVKAEKVSTNLVFPAEDRVDAEDRRFRYVDMNYAVVIDRRLAPDWLINLADNAKINAIKDVRTTLNTGVNQEPIMIGLKKVKDFVESVSKAIMHNYE